MRYTYCPDCGQLLSQRILGDEGYVPWCDRCDKPWFDTFPTCVIVLVANNDGKVLLLRQGYISTHYCNLVSGYMTPGENAESAARREVLEETGLTVTDLEMVGTWWFDRKGILMIGFIAHIDTSGEDIILSSEVDSASWHSPYDALTMVHPEGSVSHALTKYYIDHLMPY